MFDAAPWLVSCHLCDDNGHEHFGTAGVWAGGTSYLPATLAAFLAPLGFTILNLSEARRADSRTETSGAERIVEKLNPLNRVILSPLHETDRARRALARDGLPHVREIAEVSPLDSQFGVAEKKTVPDALWEPLFAQPTSPGPSLKTYAVLDAGRVIHLPALLAQSGLTHRCLFSGAAAEELAGVAPYLVELAEGNTFTRRLFTRSTLPVDLWGKEPGIFLRSSGTIEDLWRHLRKFTRLRDEMGHWHFWRFWDTPVSTTFLANGQYPAATELVRQLFSFNPGLEIILQAAYGRWLHLTQPSVLSQTAVAPLLTAPARHMLRNIRRVVEFDKVAMIALRQARSKMPFDEAEAMLRCRSLRDRLFALGFWRRDHLAIMCSWELMLGPDFIETYDQGYISAILAGISGNGAPEPGEIIDRIRAHLIETAVRKSDHAGI